MLQGGVVAGGLACAVFDVDRGVVGASGGCYALLGAHVAVLATHWRRHRRGLLNRVVKVVFLAVFAAADVFATADRGAATIGAAPTSGTSYSAHVGGLLGGFLLAVAVLGRRPAPDARHGAKRRAAAVVVLAVALAAAVAWLSTTKDARDVPWLYPDANDWDHESCCMKLARCGGNARPGLACRDRTDVLVDGIFVAADCGELRE